MTSTIKPMLAATITDVADLRYPLIASAKIDGIRCLMLTGKAVSRSLKPIRNTFIRRYLERILPDGADGELTSGDGFQSSTSAIMSQDGEPDFRYWMFDLVGSRPYWQRIEAMHEFAATLHKDSLISVLNTVVVYDYSQLLEFETLCLAQGYEGVMLRHPDGPYKCGRSTMKEGYLMKLKRFIDAEAEVIGFEEGMHNANEAKKNALGHTERSGHKDGLVPTGWLGSLRVRDLETGIEFNIGTGFDMALRTLIWKQRKQYLGKIVKYKSQPTGVKDAPRFPVFLGIRDPDDA